MQGNKLCTGLEKAVFWGFLAKNAKKNTQKCNIFKVTGYRVLQYGKFSKDSSLFKS